MSTAKIQLQRSVGPIGASLFPINGMIGSGIFALPAVLVGAVGSFAPFMILVGFFLILPLIFVFSWLATRFDQTGGPVLYGKTAFGNFFGFQAGIGLYASSMVALAANTHVMVSYLAVIFPFLTDKTTSTITVVVWIILITLINILGMRKSVNSLGFLTLLKITPLVLLVLTAVFGNYKSPDILLPQFTEAETVILLTFYAFIGFEGVTVPAGEMTNPKRDLPRVLIFILASVSLLYILIIWSYSAILDEPTSQTNALAAAAEVALGEIGALMIVLAASFSIMANGFTGLIVSPRMAYGMSEQGMLPKWFAKIHPTFLTPANSIMFFGGFAAIFSLLGGFAALAAASTLSRIFTYFICTAALPILELREGKLTLLHSSTALIAAGSLVWIASQAKAETWITMGMIILAGSFLFLAARSR